MTSPPAIFDRRAVRRQRERAASRIGGVTPVLGELASRLVDRLDDTTRRFARALDLGGRGVVAPLLQARGIAVIAGDLSPRMAARAGVPALALDEEYLCFAQQSFDLVIAHLSLHWVNDLPGALIQIRQALTPGGLFLATMPLAGTLGELRAALLAAEAGLSGGAAARISPLPDLRDCAGLLQRAGFALPVADSEEIALLYADPRTLLRDLRDAGEGNALSARSRQIPPRALFPTALAAMPREEGRTRVTLRLAFMTGWAPD
jgi:SAM-dependent methyltransferase